MNLMHSEPEVDAHSWIFIGTRISGYILRIAVCGVIDWVEHYQIDNNSVNKKLKCPHCLRMQEER